MKTKKYKNWNKIVKLFKINRVNLLGRKIIMELVNLPYYILEII